MHPALDLAPRRPKLDPTDSGLVPFDIVDWHLGSLDDWAGSGTDQSTTTRIRGSEMLNQSLSRPWPLKVVGSEHSSCRDERPTETPERPSIQPTPDLVSASPAAPAAAADAIRQRMCSHKNKSLMWYFTDRHTHRTHPAQRAMPNINNNSEDEDDFLDVEMPYSSTGPTVFGYQQALENRIGAYRLEPNSELDMNKYTPTFVHDSLMFPGTLSSLTNKVHAHVTSFSVHD